MKLNKVFNKPTLLYKFKKKILFTVKHLIRALGLEIHFTFYNV